MPVDLLAHRRGAPARLHSRTLLKRRHGTAPPDRHAEPLCTPPRAHGEADARARAAGADALDAPPSAGAAARPPPLRVRPAAQARQELATLFGVLADWLDLSPPAAARRASLGQRDRRAAGRPGAGAARQLLAPSLGLLSTRGMRRPRQTQYMGVSSALCLRGCVERCRGFHAWRALSPR